MSNPTPSKLDIIRAAGKVQREIAADVHKDASGADAPAKHVHVTTRRKDPLDQISTAQEELHDVQSSLKEDQVLIDRLRSAAIPNPAFLGGDALDDGGIDDGVSTSSRHGHAAQPGDPEDFSQEWFAKVIGAAMAAASSSSAPRSTKLKITDRKLPDFWEWQPVAWFRLFDRHVAPFNPSQAETFDALLPLLSTAACKHVQPIVRAPGLDPYSRAKSSLI